MTNDEAKDVEHLKALFASVKVPTLCRSCGTNLDYNQCFCEQSKNFAQAVRNQCFVCGERHGGLPCPKTSPYSTVTHPIKANSVAIVERCELGEHCRCAIGDHADCWNWIGEVKL